jgi:N-acetylmuramoyl-L-alanine amidase
VTIHETDNWSPTAGALNHARYLQGEGQSRTVSWHYAVDDSLITCSIPEEEHAWHAGDGATGVGNLQTCD